MKISYEWLREWVDIPVDADALAAELTMIGLQLAGMETADGDSILDLEITVNRPDCLSLRGLARETGVLFGTEPRYLPDLLNVEVIHSENTDGAYPSGEFPLHIVLEDPELCPRYCGQVVGGVTVGPSPGWLARKLESSGIRSINNVVDVTNLVMLELGQPMHVFDYHKLSQGTIRVRRVRQEKLLMIDDRERMLVDPMLVIADANRAVAVGGVMGGKESEVTDRTTVVLLESAYFQPACVRVTAKKLEMSTDASFRFERGADPEIQATACRRAALLLEQLAGGKAQPVLDVTAAPPAPIKIEMRPERVERILGVKISPEFMERTLLALGFRKSSGNIWTVPSFRVDVFREIDLIEEIARHYGYNRFPDTLPKAEKKYQPDYATYELERNASQYLRGAGIDEASTFSFGTQGEVQILNPVSETGTRLRTSLIPGLLESIEYNLRHRNREARLFEIGHSFLADGEKTMLGIAMIGEYREFKGILESLFPALGYGDASWNQAILKIGDQQIGTMQQRAIAGHEVQACEISLTDVVTLPKREIRNQPIIPFPFVERDASFVLDASIPYLELQQVFAEIKMQELRSYQLVDRYQGDNIPAGKVSLSFRFIFQSETRTLTSEEVDALYDQIVGKISSRFGADLRR